MISRRESRAQQWRIPWAVDIQHSPSEWQHKGCYTPTLSLETRLLSLSMRRRHDDTLENAKGEDDVVPSS